MTTEPFITRLSLLDLAKGLHAAGFNATQSAPALKRKYPTSSAEEFGSVLISVWAALDQTATTEALQQVFWQEEVTAAISSLFPGAALALWAGSYTAAAGYGGAGIRQTWDAIAKLEITAAGTVSFGSQPINGYRYANNQLAWDWAGNTNAASIHFTNQADPGYHWADPMLGKTFTGWLHDNPASGLLDYRGHDFPMLPVPSNVELHYINGAAVINWRSAVPAPGSITNLGLAFDGHDDFVSLPAINAPVLSWETWLYPQPQLGAKKLIWRDHPCGFQTMWEDGTLTAAYIGDLNDGVGWVTVSASSLAADQWYHVAAVIENNTLVLYLNGVAVATNTASMTPTAVDHGVMLGRWNDFGYDFKGYLSEVRLWSTARSAHEISTYWQQRLTGSESGLVVYLPLDEGTGNTVGDRSGHDTNGSLGNGNWVRMPQWVGSITGYRVELRDSASRLLGHQTTSNLSASFNDLAPAAGSQLQARVRTLTANTQGPWSQVATVTL